MFSAELPWWLHPCTSALTTVVVRSRHACGVERPDRTAEASRACALRAVRRRLTLVCTFVFLLLPAFIMGDQALMDEVTAEIKAVCKKLEEVEAEIKQAQDEHNNEEVAALRKEKEQLRKKEEQLRTKEEQLRAEKLLLLERERGALV